MDQVCISRYREAAEKYRPRKIALLIIAESAPWFASDKDMSYFYFEDNPGNDMFFSTIVRGILGTVYSKNIRLKKELLRQLQSEGVWLTDAVEYPINRTDNGEEVSDREREEIIADNVRNLLERLGSLKNCAVLSEETGVVLIKKTVFNTVKSELTERGFNVLNDTYVPFPRYPGDPNVVDRLNDLWKRQQRKYVCSNN